MELGSRPATRPLADGSVEWTCRCGAGEVAVSPAAAEAEADAHALPRDEHRTKVAALMEHHAAVRAAVAATLRQVAGWGLVWEHDGQSARDDLCDIAMQVERMEPGDMCCPVCEEVTCDEDCPLAGHRRP